MGKAFGFTMHDKQKFASTMRNFVSHRAAETLDFCLHYQNPRY